MDDFPIDFSKLDLSSVMEMANKLKERMKQMEESLAKIEVESVVGGGMVTVKANARGEVLSISMDPELLSEPDKEMIEGLVAAGVNQALAEAKKRREQEMQRMTGGMVPPGFPGMLA